jgi:hypothetical protein
MKCKKQEVDFLVKNKEIEGKDTKLIYQEINNLKESQKIFKLVHQENKSLKLKLFNQEKQITNLKEQLNKQKKKIFDLTMKKDIKKDIQKDIGKPSEQKHANVFHLKRILNYLEENPRVIKTRIKEGCCINFEQLNSGLMFLERVNLIKNEGTIYERNKI